MPVREGSADPVTRRGPEKGALVAVLGLAALPLLLGLAQPPDGAKVVDAEKFILRGADGKPRAELGLQADRPSLALFDEKGHCRARLAVAADGSANLSLHDRDGQRRAALLVPPEGEPRLDFAKNLDPVSASVRAISVADRPEPAPGKEERTPAGQELFRQLCVRCHGTDGRGGNARAQVAVPDFTSAAWQGSRTDAQLTASILTGRGDVMPGFTGRVSAARARELVAFIRTFGPARKKGLPAPGGEFEDRFRRLETEYDDLKKQLKEMASPRRNP
jgi:mono/diheme cytochrome c family protein